MFSDKNHSYPSMPYTVLLERKMHEFFFVVSSAARWQVQVSLVNFVDLSDS